MSPKQGETEAAALERLLPKNGDLQELILRWAEHRGRPLTLIPWPFPPKELTGLWLATDAGDYIVHPQDAPPTRRAAIICHELAHMALGHQPTPAEALESLASTVAPHVAPGVAARFLAREPHHDGPQEVAAEQLATRLVAHLSVRAARSSWGGVYDRLH